MKKLIITCHPTSRSTIEGMNRILYNVRELARNSGIQVNWRDEEEDKFIQGIVAALDVVALYDQPVIFKEIIETAGTKKVLAEIKINGSERSKNLARQEYPECVK